MKGIQGQSGQGVVEMVLLMAVVVSISLLVTQYLQNNKAAQKLFGDPWNKLAGMIECGVWTGCGEGKHPSSVNRILSLKPDE